MLLLVAICKTYVNKLQFFSEQGNEQGVSNVWNGIWTGMMEWNRTDVCVTYQLE